MSGTQQAGNKICKLCGQDCSTRPRIKDKAGRYFCRECYEKAKKKSAPAAPPTSPATGEDSDDGVDWASEMLGMEAAAPAVSGGLHACPKCNSPLGAGVVLCTQCGYNSKTGKRSAAAVAEPVGAARKASSSRTGGGAPEFLKNPWFIFAAITGFFVIMALVSRGNESLAPVSGGLFGAYFLVTRITVLVCAFQRGIGTGFLTLCLPLFDIYFVFFMNDSRTVKVMYGALAASVLVLGALGSMSMPALE